MTQKPTTPASAPPTKAEVRDLIQQGRREADAAGWTDPDCPPVEPVEPRGCACVVPVLVGGVCECQQPQAAPAAQRKTPLERSKAHFAQESDALHQEPQAPTAEPRCSEFREYCSPGCMLPVGHDGDHVMPQEWYEREITTLRADLACCEELRKSGESEVGELNAEIVTLQEQLAALRAERDANIAALMDRDAEWTRISRQYDVLLAKKRAVDSLYTETSALFHAVIEAAEGRPVSDFMESFGGVRLVVDLRQERDAALARAEQLQEALTVMERSAQHAVERAEQAMQQEHGRRLDSERNFGALMQQLEATRSALAEAQRTAFMAGYAYGDQIINDKPAEAYAVWLAAQSKETP